MEDKTDLELRDENIFPDEKVLNAALGPAYKGYEKALALFGQNELSHEWRYYNDGKAWLCKVQKKKKTIAWMSAWKNYFKVTFYFPLRLLDDILALNITDKMRETFKASKNSGKIKPLTFTITSPELPEDFEKVLKFKIVSK